MIDFTTTPPLRIGEIVRQTKVNKYTVIRWITRGVVVRGNRVKLSGEKIGGQWITTQAAWDEFRLATNPQAEPTRVDAIPSETDRRSRHDAAMKEARRMGLKV